MDIRKYFIVNNEEPIKKSTPTKNPVFKNIIETQIEKTDKKAWYLNNLTVSSVFIDEKPGNSKVIILSA